MRIMHSDPDIQRPLTPTEEELLAETETTCLMIEEHVAEPAREQDLEWPSVVVF